MRELMVTLDAWRARGSRGACHRRQDRRLDAAPARRENDR